jgi:glutathione S-transferase
MHWIALITVLALIEYLVFQGFVGAARQRAKIPAPKVVGDETYERWYRVQLNTVEQLIIFLPALWLCARGGATTVATIAGFAFLIGRAIYAASYVQDPEKRTIGFLLGYLANVVLIVRAGWSAVVSVLG